MQKLHGNQRPGIQPTGSIPPAPIRIFKRLLGGTLLKNRLLLPFLDYLSYRVRLEESNFEAWCYSWIMNRNRALYGITNNKVYFEFGVFEGDSLLKFISAAKKFCRQYNEPLTNFWVFGFDSFSGLPEKQEGDDQGSWHSGKYACDLETVKNRVLSTGFPESNLFLIPGFYEESLTGDLRDKLLRDSMLPAIVTIDCDYYSSTKTVIDWLNQLLISGTPFYFDDIWSFHGHPNMGELRAINEFNREGNGHLTRRGIYGLEDQTYIYSTKEWEFGENSSYQTAINMP